MTARDALGSVARGVVIWLRIAAIRIQLGEDPHMYFRKQLVMRFMIAALLAAPVIVGACAGYRGNDRVYDPFYYDYHRWNRAELGYYRRWEAETQRPHLDFGRRPLEDQHAYFTWRHGR